MTWRDKARPIIEQAIREGAAQGLTGKDLYRFVSKRYPWGTRANHPYQIWLDELAYQMGTKTKRNEPVSKDLEGQGRLF